ncbi:ABC transporter permease [Streptomyces sp. NPDC006798]|uniref:ABC transporter permease n=1 Tax=Streptomyces sp. NPDC006798 TaxID=3155462 RepID=UPI0033E56DD4
MKHALDTVTAWLARGVIAFLYIPIVVVVVLSFNDSEVTYKWAGFSTRWYGELSRNTELLAALRISAETALVSATLATLCGLLAAMGMARLRARGKAVFSGGLFLPLIIPEIVLGVALLSVFGAMSADLGMRTLILGHLVVTLPYAALIVLGAYNALDPSLAEAATDLGCNAWQSFRRVTLPLLRQPLLAAWLLSFTISFGNIVMSTFTNGIGSTTLPLRVYSMLKGGLTPEINALGTLLVLFTLLIILGVGVRQMRRVLLGAGRS